MPRSTVSAVLSCAPAAAALLAAAPALGFEILNDPFDDPTYAVTEFNNDTLGAGGNPNDVSFAAFGDTFPTGGNPDAYSQIVHVHGIAEDEDGNPEDPSAEDPFDTFVQSSANELTVSYDASGPGALGTLTYSLDVRTTAPLEALSFLLEDLDARTGRFLFVDQPLLTDGAWNTYTLTLAAGDADLADANGGPIGFGFGFITSADVSNGGQEFAFDVDNFVVTGTPVPEPAGAALALAGLALFARRRRVA